jgi:hypothetical protein
VNKFIVELLINSKYADVIVAGDKNYDEYHESYGLGVVIVVGFSSHCQSCPLVSMA